MSTNNNSDGSKKRSEASRLFIGGKSLLDRFPELAWLFEPVGRNVNQLLEWSSICVSRRYGVAIDLTKLPIVEFGQKKLHDDELNSNLADQLPFQVKMGLLTTDHVDKNKMKKKKNGEFADVEDPTSESPNQDQNDETGKSDSSGHESDSEPDLTQDNSDALDDSFIDDSEES